MSPSADCQDCSWSYEGGDIIVVGDKRDRHARKEQHDVSINRDVATDGGREETVDDIRAGIRDLLDIPESAGAKTQLSSSTLSRAAKQLDMEAYAGSGPMLRKAIRQELAKRESDSGLVKEQVDASTLRKHELQRLRTELGDEVVDAESETRDEHDRVKLGEIHAASVLDVEGRAVLAIKGADGTASVVVPEDMVAPLEHTVSEVGLVYDDAEAETALIGDGGSKYTNPTGDGYLGVYSVSSNTVGMGVGMFPVDWDGNTTVWASEESPGVAVVEAEPADYLAKYQVSKGWRNHPGPTLSVGATALDPLDVEDGDDVRVYERDAGGIMLVAADPDPMLVADGGEEPLPPHACSSGYSCGFVIGLEEDRFCGARASDEPDAYVCTRPEGHEGPHVACGGGETEDDHGLHIWEPEAQTVADPPARVREAIKQITIVRDEISPDRLSDPALDEAEVLLRGVADRLENGENSDEVVTDGGVPVMSGTVTEARPHSTEDDTLVARVLFDLGDVPENIPVEEWLPGSEVTFSVDAGETDGHLVPDGGHVAGPSHSIAGSPRDFGCSDWHCGGCHRHHVDAEPWITVKGESYCSRECYAQESQFLQKGLHLCEGCQRVFESVRHLAVHDCGAGPLAAAEGGGARA